MRPSMLPLWPGLKAVIIGAFAGISGRLPVHAIGRQAGTNARRSHAGGNPDMVSSMAACAAMTMRVQTEGSAAASFSAAGSSSRFRADWSPMCGLNLDRFLGPVQFPKRESNLCPSDRYLPLPQLADGLRQSLFEQRVQVLVGCLGRVLQRSAMVGSRLAHSGGVQIQ